MRLAALRIIPARAGFTPALRGHSGAARDHPRSRGVYGLAIGSDGRRDGSSPLARGLQLGGSGPPDGGGIIPARAGFTSTSDWYSLDKRDHPRSRGVYFYPAVYFVLRPGSSPLARGLPPARRAPRTSAWIIPARAGFTSRPGAGLHGARDHPRSRGVYLCNPVNPPRSVGSSPLARGLPARHPRRFVLLGIIPARAGFTAPSRRPKPRPSDHPRSRGVYGTAFHLLAQQRGSSPLARGLRKVPDPSWVGAGIIPARAGFTGGDGDDGARILDHPRSRGVYSRVMVAATRRMGSSPLARGLHLRIVGIPTNP